MKYETNKTTQIIVCLPLNIGNNRTFAEKVAKNGCNVKVAKKLHLKSNKIFVIFLMPK